MRTIWLCLIVVLACLALTLIPNFANAVNDTGNPGIGITQAVNADPPDLQPQVNFFYNLSNINTITDDADDTDSPNSTRPMAGLAIYDYTRHATAGVSILNCPRGGVPIPDYGDTTGMATNNGESDGRCAIYNLPWPGLPTL